jgi:hypothetical protein
MASEQKEQNAFVRWLDHVAAKKWPELCLPNGKLPYTHIPNGGKRSARQGRTLKIGGVQPGVLDFVLFVPMMNYGALLIELKQKGGSLSKEQKEWIGTLSRLGYVAHVCIGHKDAIDTVTRYLEGSL